MITDLFQHLSKLLGSEAKSMIWNWWTLLVKTSIPYFPPNTQWTSTDTSWCTPSPQLSLLKWFRLYMRNFLTWQEKYSKFTRSLKILGLGINNLSIINTTANNTKQLLDACFYLSCSSIYICPVFFWVSCLFGMTLWEGYS